MLEFHHVWGISSPKYCSLSYEKELMPKIYKYHYEIAEYLSHIKNSGNFLRKVPKSDIF